jgi:hypothetical protein
MKNFPHGSLPPVEFDRPFDGTVKVIIAVTQQTLRALCGIDYPASGCAKLRKHMTPLSAQLLSRADAGGPIGTPNKSAGTKSAIVTGGHGTMLVRAI